MTNGKMPEEFNYKMIEDPIAIEWYNFGFRFAINYAHKIMLPESKTIFEAVLTRELLTGIETDFFIDPAFEKNYLYAKVMNPIANRWYVFGFRFALNYIYQTLAPSEKKIFSTLPDENLREIIEEDFFEVFPFESGYRPGWCPGDRPGSCIQCPDYGIEAVVMTEKMEIAKTAKMTKMMKR